MAAPLETAHAAVGILIDGLLWPGRLLCVDWEWVWAALLTGAVLSLLWSRLQSPGRLQIQFSQAWAGLLAVWLFRHEPMAAARAQVRALRSNLLLLFWLLLPVAISVALSSPLFVHLQARYGYQVLRSGETIVVHFDCTDAAAASRLRVDGPGAAIQVEAVVREPAKNAAVARVRARRDGHHQLLISTGGVQVPVPVSVGLPPRAVMLGGGLAERLLQPGGRVLSSDMGLTRITLAYEPAAWRWWLWFGGVSCVGACGALGLSRRLVVRTKRRSQVHEE